MKPSKPIVFVPGIKGSGLENSYPMEPATTWSAWRAVAGGSLKSLLLDLQGEVDEWDDVVNRPTQALHIAYAKFVEGLRGRLEVPIYVFPYDWRLSCGENGRRLASFVEHLRKKPMHALPGWRKAGGLVDLVCHSMGGLVARAALQEWGRARGERPPVGNLVFIATPHLGSLDSVKAMIVGDTPILDFRKELRKLARSLPSVYELLPRFEAPVVAKGAPRTALEVFDLRSWQSNVTSPSDELLFVLQRRLDEARRFLEELPWPDDRDCKVQGKVFSVYGVREGSTLVQVPVDTRRADPKMLYLFDEAKKGAGDEVVPVVSAIPDALGGVRVAVPYSDAGFWPSELPARVSFHAFLCALDEVQTMVGRFLESPSTRKLEKMQPINLRLGLGAPAAR
ncbi:MAG TPA: hypothetical protein PK668_12705 [Myxococcota bacterium]|nr:hypothetical protein [Myxococcota bacterium]HRY93669.1 hypothetical protein [Myxococcota bacterium]